MFYKKIMQMIYIFSFTFFCKKNNQAPFRGGCKDALNKEMFAIANNKYALKNTFLFFNKTFLTATLDLHLYFKVTIFN